MNSKTDYSVHYLELCENPVRFDPVSALTNVFFDDAKQEVFAVRSGGATGIVVNSPLTPDTISFVMDKREPIRSIKFSQDNKILAIQRAENEVEFIAFSNNAPIVSEMIVHKHKSTVFGFAWIAPNEVALFGSGSVESFHVHFENKKQLRSIKSCNLTVDWFSWCPSSSFALLSSGSGTVLTPVLLKPGVITKLPKLELEPEISVMEKDVTLGVLYGISSVLVLQKTNNRVVEVIIYTLSGPGLAPKKSHILKLAYNGRFAINIVDDLVIVHHQASKTSHIFDILLQGERDQVTGVVSHVPLTPGKPIKPFVLKLPSLLPSDTTNTVECELYSPDWVLFQPNIVIDAKLGCLWNVILKLEPLSQFIGDYVKLVDFLLRRTGGKSILLGALHDLLSTQYSGIKLPIIEKIFDKLNVIYKDELDNELLRQMGMPYNKSAIPISKNTNPPRVLIDQSDMFSCVFSTIADANNLGHVLMLYINSLAKHKITLQYELSKMIIMELIRTKRINTLHQLLTLSVINESKPLACFLLSVSKTDKRILQASCDMLARLNASEIILEVLLEQGHVVEALRIAKQSPNADFITARKYLEAAQKLNDPVTFHAVYAYFQQRNVRLRGSPEFLRQEQCADYVQHYQKLMVGSELLPRNTR